MMPLPEPGCRTLPVEIPRPVRAQIIAGRVRLMHVPGPRAACLEAGDCLWAREMFRVLPAGPGLIDVCYGGDRERGLRWPSVLARPPAMEVHLPEAMPVHLSRMTLVVLRARTIRLHQVTEEDACAAGVIAHRDGFGHAWAPESHSDTALEAYGRMWDLWHGNAGRLGWAVNPEVREIAFTAVARNIADLVPGIGNGGAR